MSAAAIRRTTRRWLAGRLPTAASGRWLAVTQALAFLQVLGLSHTACAQKPETAAGDRAAIEKVLKQLDERFDAGDVAGYLGLFAADHPGSLAMLGRHLERLCARTKSRRRTSAVVVGPRRVGTRSLVRVRHNIAWQINGASETQAFVEDTYLALRIDAAGQALPTFAVAVPAATECVPGGKIHCPACNYEIGGADGWLCVPRRRENALAIEAASFYLVGTGLACDVSVHVEPRVTTAKTAAERLASAFGKLEPKAIVGIPSSWIPTNHAANPPTGLDAARVIVELPNDHRGAGGGLAIFHVVTFGGLQHLLLVRGSSAAVARHQPRIDELFATYMLLEADCNLATAAARPLRIHVGGVLEDELYRNERFNIDIRGPEGWQAEQRVGGSAFRVRWSGAGGSRMWLIGHAVPAGMNAWSKATADYWLEHMCNQRQGGLKPTPESLAADESQWREGPGGAACKTLVMQASQPKDPAAPRRRLLHVQLHDDLLMIVEGFAGSAADEQALRTAARSLRRK